jgi:hypothetical protein
MQRPGIPGAGNVMDPEVRAELREKLHEAAPAPMHQPPAGAAPPAEKPAESPPAKHRAGPFPHGDVDLSGFAPNVPPGPVRVKRGGTRSYYFLKQTEDTAPEESPAIQPPAGPKPG